MQVTLNSYSVLHGATYFLFNIMANDGENIFEQHGGVKERTHPINLNIQFQTLFHPATFYWNGVPSHESE
jgi:hypothetical protein